ncbi:MAG: SulP family inorganic anion transporter [Alphaproteobacteria bacterium]|nr:MAG: SulP family inorganic anion transporter [Alphaproteobacteria bacterium]
MFPNIFKGYSREEAAQDIIASVTVGLIAFPLALSISTATGLPPQAGLVATIIGGILAAILGGTRFVVSGPNTIFFFTIIEAFNTVGFEGLLLATFIMGLILIGAGFAKLGFIIDYVPYSVTLGFMSGLSVVIISMVLKECLGLTQPLAHGNLIIQSWTLYFTNFWNTNIFSFLMSVIVITSLRYYKGSRYPVFIGAILATTLIAMIFRLPVETIGSRYADFSTIFSRARIPNLLSINLFVESLPYALTMTAVAVINSLLNATVVHDKTNTPVNPNQELIAQGAANVASACFGGLPVSATLSRTLVNIEQGAKTSLSSLFQAIFVWVLLLFSLPLLKKIPLACLNAVLLSIAFDILEPKKLWEQIKLPHGESVVCMTTFFLTIFVNNGVAILVGTMIAAFLFIHKMSHMTNVQSESTFSDIHEGIKVYHIDGPFFFGASSRLKVLLEEDKITDKVIVFDLKNMPLIDSTGSVLLTKIIKENKDTEFIMINVNEEIQAFFQHIGLSKKRHYSVTNNLEEAIKIAKQIIKEKKKEEKTNHETTET